MAIADMPVMKRRPGAEAADVSAMKATANLSGGIADDGQAKVGQAKVAQAPEEEVALLAKHLDELDGKREVSDE